MGPSPSPGRTRLLVALALESQAWFRFLSQHHYIHHVDPEANENFLLPLADCFFGTLRLSITEEEKAAVESRHHAAQTPA